MFTLLETPPQQSLRASENERILEGDRWSLTITKQTANYSYLGSGKINFGKKLSEIPGQYFSQGLKPRNRKFSRCFKGNQFYRVIDKKI